MYVLNNICFVCLTESGKNNMDIVSHKETKGKNFIQVKYTLPELEIPASELPVYICSSCSISFSYFCTFKKQCLENYSRWKHYIQILQETSDTQEPRYGELKVRVSNCEGQIKQAQELDTKLNIKEENEDLLPPSSGNEKQIFNDLQIKIDDIPMIKPEPELHIISNIKYINETVVEDNIFIKELIAEEEEIFTVTLNIRDKNEDAFLSSQEKTNIKSNIEGESLSPEKIGDKRWKKKPDLENVQCESVSDDELEGRSSVTSGEDTGSQEFKCIMCNNIFSEKSTLDNHLRDHIKNTKGLECLICKKTLAKNDVLKRHLKFHFGFKDYKCSLCHNKYVRQSSLDFHMKIHASAKVQCEYCNKKFYNLQDHMRLHFDDKEFECAVCNKKFTQKRLLKTHFRRHADIKGFECTVCDKKFLENGSLKRHMEFHLGIKCYKCTICEKEFGTKTCFKIHMDTHAGIRKFECKICSKRFVEKKSLKNHIKYHLNIRNFECTICTKKFVTNSHLKTHMNSHLDIRNFECPVCKRKFVQQSNMKSHMKRHKDTQCDQNECPPGQNVN